MKDWLVFFLHGIKETADSSISVFKGIIAMKERIEREVLPHFSSRRQENVQNLMQYLYKQPVMDVKAVSILLETTTNTASLLVSDLVRHGVLEEVTMQRRNRLFVFRHYLELFRG